MTLDLLNLSRLRGEKLQILSRSINIPKVVSPKAMVLYGLIFATAILSVGVVAVYAFHSGPGDLEPNFGDGS